METNFAWSDISMPLTKGVLVWPDDPAFEMEKISAIENGEEVNITKLVLCVHTGTHIDAPLHYIANGNDVTQISPDVLIGDVKVIEISDHKIISVEELSKHVINCGDRILFKTANSLKGLMKKPFEEDFVSLTREASAFLVDKKIALAGIDYLSIAKYKESSEVHLQLLKAGICILEGLLLAHIEPGEYEMVCLPLNIPGAEGSPARALIRKKRR